MPFEPAMPHEPAMTTLSDKLLTLMTTLQLEDAPAGGSVVVYQRGKIIGQASVGQATPNEAWSSNTLSLNFSTGKGILVTLVHILVSNGLLAYDKPIAYYWPNFAGNGKADITLQAVLTHRADLFNIQTITQQTADVLDWVKMLAAVETMAPEAPKNSRAESCYSALVSGWVLGGLIEKVTGLSLNAALDKYLAEPLGVVGQMYFGVPAEKVSQVATLAKNFADFDVSSQPHSQPQAQDSTHQTLKAHSSAATHRSAQSKRNKPKRYKPTFRPDTPSILQAYQTLPSYECWRQLATNEPINRDGALTTLNLARLYFSLSGVNVQDFKHALVPSGLVPLDYYSPAALMATIPAANAVASSWALAKMYAMLANKGVWQGKTLICPETFAQLSTIYVTGSDAIMPVTHPNSMHWRLGYHRLFSRCHDVTQLSNGFGHMGYNGSVAWCDSDRDLAVAYVHNYEVTMSTDIRQFAITEAVLQWVT